LKPTFMFSNLKTSSREVAKDGTVNISSVQLYLKHLGSKVERPREQLAGFRRVTLQPNETKTVEIALPASRLAYWDVKLQAFRVESETVSLTIGDSSANIALTGTVEVQ